MTDEAKGNGNSHKREPLPIIRTPSDAIEFHNRIIARFDQGQLGHKELTALAFVADKAVGAMRLEADLVVAELKKELELLRNLTGMQSREATLAAIATAEVREATENHT